MPKNTQHENITDTNCQNMGSLSFSSKLCLFRSLSISCFLTLFVTWPLSILFRRLLILSTYFFASLTQLMAVINHISDGMERNWMRSMAPYDNFYHVNNPYGMTCITIFKWQQKELFLVVFWKQMMLKMKKKALQPWLKVKVLTAVKVNRFLETQTKLCNLFLFILTKSRCVLFLRAMFTPSTQKSLVWEVA